MENTSNVNQLVGGTPTAGQLAPGTLETKGTVVGGALYTPTHIVSGVESVNGMTGNVTIDASDVGAASQQDFAAHVENDTIHVTAADKAAWNQCLIGAVNADEGLTFWQAQDVI